MDRERFKLPLTRKKPFVASTKPPAFVMRVDSISLLGLWSKDRGDGDTIQTRLSNPRRSRTWQYLP